MIYFSFQNIFKLSIIRILKGTKNEGFEKYEKENSSKEYNYLKQIIDNNPSYLDRLVIKNEFCRYSDIRTYKDNTVKIYSNNQYINASWIHIPNHNFFIATQGPLQSTIEHFWDMCFSYDVDIIIMICNLKENDKEKCANYWEINSDKYQIVKVNEESDDGIIIRKMQINNKKNILHLQLTTWDDHTAPIDNYNRIIKMINFIDKNKNDKPIVVHCSAGVGRTGCFISLYNLYEEVMGQINDEKKKYIIFSIFNTVRKLKELRKNSVENENQYTFLYEFINLLLKEKN